MKPQKFFSIAHKYLSLIIGVQIFLWVGSGLFFSIVPIEKIRGEDLIKERANIALKNDDFAGLNKILAQNQTAPKIELYSNSTGSIVKIDKNYFDGKTGTPRANISKEAAILIANNALKKARTIKSSELIERKALNIRVNYHRGKLPIRMD